MGSSLELFAIIEKAREPERQVRLQDAERKPGWDPLLRLHGKICVGFKYKGGAQLGTKMNLDFET